MAELLGKAQNPSEEHPMGVTVDGVHIEPGLVVWTNEYRAGIVQEPKHREYASTFDGWFDVRYPSGGGALQNPERVATEFEGKRAIDELTRTVELYGVTVNMYPSTTEPDHISVQIDTIPGRRVLVFLNDGDLFRGDPEHRHPLVGGPRDVVITAAIGLLGDGQGDEWDVNTEYTRAIVELVRDTCDLGEVELEHDDVYWLLRDEFTKRREAKEA